MAVAVRSANCCTPCCLRLCQLAGLTLSAILPGPRPPAAHTLPRQVQDFTQGELLLDMVVAADPNSLFYCGDTAQTIARGIGCA